jgi:hypothetical protein
VLRDLRAILPDDLVAKLPAERLGWSSGSISRHWKAV